MAPAARKAPGSRIAYLDSLRGLAALSVVFSHYFLAYGFPESVAGPLTNSPLHLFWDGFAAVSLFFVLSGYVLARKHVRTGPPHFFRFALARIVRIWMPYLAMLLLSFALYRLFPPGGHFTFETPWFRKLWGPVKPLWEQAVLYPNTGEGRLVPQDWTLTQELGLSFLLPVFVLVVRRSSLALLFLGAVLIGWLKLPMLTAHFLLGVLLAKHEEALLAFVGQRGRPFRLGLLLLGLFCYSYRFSVPLLYPALMPEHRIWYVTGVGSLLLLVFAMADPALQRVLSRPLPVRLGNLSYTLYLCHFGVLLAFLPRFVSFVKSAGMEGENGLRLAGLCFMVATSLLVAEALYWLVDKPCIRASRWVMRAGRRKEEAGA